MKNGFIALSTILIVSVVVLAISVTVSLLAIGQGQSALSLTKGEENLGLVEGCAEDAMLKARADSNYAGGALSRPQGSCSITVVSKVSNIWTVDVNSVGENFSRKVRIIFNRTPPAIILTNWKEI